MDFPGPSQQNNDSDNDEGFVVNQVEINQKHTTQLTFGSSSRPNDYQPRYIIANNLIRKQLPEVVQSYPHFPQKDFGASPQSQQKREREEYFKIQQHNFPNKNYHLVYQRNNRKMDAESISSQNHIDLSSAVSYCSDSYAILKSWDHQVNEQDLFFQSRFQCGNLLYAFKKLNSPNHYVLFIQNDTNTKGYNKWFYFAVRNAKKQTPYTFSIVNFRKNLSIIKHGLKPIRFSVKEQQARGNGWSRCDKKVHMYRSRIGQDSESYPFNEHYTLTFEVTFSYDQDINLFSLLPTYSYSKMINFLIDSEQKTKQRTDLTFSIKTISYSLSNTQVPYVTITSPSAPSNKNIIILARQHPGEVWSSFFVESLIKQLLRDSFPEKDWLINNFTFRIFPMINVDGVIYGNFRCDLSGSDLNRCWKEPNKLLHPHIVAIKEEIKRLASEQQVISCFDLHAHSKQFNIFAYCCKTDTRSRVLPLILSKMSSLFYFPLCTFGISKYKQTTARAVINEITKANDVLTFQTSFFAAQNPFKMITPSIFLSFSQSLLKTLKSYYSKDQFMRKAEEDLPKMMTEVASLRSKHREKYALKEESGSDSEPDIDQIAISQKIGIILPKCAVVDQAFALKQKESIQLETIPRARKEVKKKEKKMQKSLPVSRKTISEEPIFKKNFEKPVVIPKPRVHSTNTVNNFLERISKRKEDKIEEKNRVREYSMRTKTKHMYNDSLDLSSDRKPLNKFLEEELGTSFRETLRENKLRYEMEEVHDKKEEFPLLCVLSDSKKEAHLRKLKRIQPISPPHSNIVRFQPTFVLNKKLDTMQRLRERQKKSSDLVSSLWKDTLGYNKDGPVTHIFYSER